MSAKRCKKKKAHSQQLSAIKNCSFWNKSDHTRFNPTQFLVHLIQLKWIGCLTYRLPAAKSLKIAVRVAKSCGGMWGSKRSKAASFTGQRLQREYNKATIFYNLIFKFCICILYIISLLLVLLSYYHCHYYC